MSREEKGGCAAAEKKRGGCAAAKWATEKMRQILFRAAQDKTKWLLFAKREILIGHKEEVCQSESGSALSQEQFIHRNY